MIAIVSYRQRGISRTGALILALLAGVGIVTAWFLLGRGNTNAPSLVSPADDAAIAGTAGGTSVTFEWRHGFATLDNRHPRRVSHFVICVLATGQQCAWPGTHPPGSALEPLLTWTATAESIQRVTFGVPAGAIELYEPRFPTLDRPYQYTFPAPAPIPASRSGQTLRWTVGACNGEVNANCRFAESRAFRPFGEVNLVAESVQDYNNNRVVVADALARNDGQDASGGITTDIRLVQILIDSNNRVRTDVYSPGFTDAAQLVLPDGRIIERRDLPPGYDLNLITGIVVTGGESQAETDSSPGLAPGQSSLSVAHLEHTTSAVPSRFAVIFHLDPDNRIPETDETDNGKAERSSTVR